MVAIEVMVAKAVSDAKGNKANIDANTNTTYTILSGLKFF